MADFPPINMAAFAGDYDAKRGMDPEDFERLLSLIIGYARVDGPVLEVGCGTGFYLLPLAERLPGVGCCGIEPADAMLVQARDKVRDRGLRNCLLAKADGHSLPFADSTFDFVLMSQVLHFLGDRPRAVGEANRVCTPRARLLVITTSHPQLRAQVDLAFFPGVTAGDIARIPTIAEIRRLFEAEGFDLYATVEHAGTFRAASAEALVRRVARKIWSSYFLLSEEEFARGLTVFRKRLEQAFGRGEIAYLVPQTLMFFRRG